MRTILSGIQPSGSLHIGNYLGAIKQWVALQESNTAYYCIVDLHAITVSYEVSELQKNILDTAATYLAAGIDPAKSTLFVQSHVAAHSELAWLLTTQTPLGDLGRMTQFKDKAANQKGKESLGLFSYPILMAADILLYNTHLVPVGEDQIQHIELARDIAKRFNNKFGDTFKLPKPYINKNSARIMSLTDPTKKMSKTDPEKSRISIVDDVETISKKISSAVTETKPVFSFSTSGPAVSNLLKIYQTISGHDPNSIESKFAGQGYQEFKEDLANLLIEKLSPLREKYIELRSDETSLKKILAAGANQATQVANKTLSDVKHKMGLV